MSIDAILENQRSEFEQPISHQIWDQKYRLKRPGGVMEATIFETWKRVASGLAAAETYEDRPYWAEQFFEAMRDFKLLPGGRILAGCGAPRDVTMFNTFVMPTLPDSVDGIMDTMKVAARTMKRGGGIGFDFSTIRPKGTEVRGLDCPAAGPLAAMDIADAICAMLVSGSGRGAMMATLAADHPDIEAFIEAKSQPGRFRNFNLSVLVPDRFMDAVEADGPWMLRWNGQTVRQVQARTLWEKILQRTYQYSEPGVLFVDRINSANPLGYLETISATNSCAEQPLPPNGACPLASVNLAQLVRDPFTPQARLDTAQLSDLARTAVRMLDNVIETGALPEVAQAEEVRSKRRIGLGITGLGNALIMLDVAYGSEESTSLLDQWMAALCNAAYEASANLARERGVFPAFDAAQHLSQPVIQRLDPWVREEIAKSGLRNGVLTTIAPTGTTSMLAGNISSGIEPVFAASFQRRITRADGSQDLERIEDFAAKRFRDLFGAATPLPDSYVTANDLLPAEHVRVQAAVQRWIDSGISKTVNCPEDMSFGAFESVYFEAYKAGCKGCTTFRPNETTGTILSL